MHNVSDGPIKCHTRLSKHYLSYTIFEHTFESEHYTVNTGQIVYFPGMDYYFSFNLFSQGMSGAILPRSVPIVQLNGGNPCTSNFGIWSQANVSLVLSLAQNILAGSVCGFSFIVTNPTSGQVIKTLFECYFVNYLEDFSFCPRFLLQAAPSISLAAGLAGLAPKQLLISWSVLRAPTGSSPTRSALFIQSMQWLLATARQNSALVSTQVF
jgi:hypothetical protein